MIIIKNYCANGKSTKGDMHHTFETAIDALLSFVQLAVCIGNEKVQFSSINKVHSVIYLRWTESQGQCTIENPDSSDHIHCLNTFILFIISYLRTIVRVKTDGHYAVYGLFVLEFYFYNNFFSLVFLYHSLLGFLLCVPLFFSQRSIYDC